jgi:hypothetical protein
VAADVHDDEGIVSDETAAPEQNIATCRLVIFENGRQYAGCFFCDPDALRDSGCANRNSAAD